DYPERLVVTPPTDTMLQRAPLPRSSPASRAMMPRADESVDRVDPLVHPCVDRYGLHDVQHRDDVELQQVGERRGGLERGGCAVGLGNEHPSHAIGGGPVTLEGEAGRRLPGLEALESDPLVNAIAEPVSATYEH